MPIFPKPKISQLAPNKAMNSSNVYTFQAVVAAKNVPRVQKVLHVASTIQLHPPARRRVHP
jgi:hypothetical protein